MNAISAIQSSFDANSLYSKRAREAQPDEKSGNRNTGPDTVFLSEEALELARNYRPGDPGASSPNDESEGEPGAGDQFSAYMSGKRSKAQGGGAKERLKGLQENLKNLQSQLSQLTSGESGKSGASGRIENIQSQINSTMAQIAEASAQAAEEEAAENAA